MKSMQIKLTKNTSNNVLKFTIFSLLLVVSSNFANSQPSFSEFFFTFIDQKGNVKQNSIVHLEINGIDNNSSFKYDKYLPNGILKLRIKDGLYRFIVLARETNSTFYNYFSEQEFNTKTASENETIILMPVAYIRGIVIDKADNLINGAVLKYECSGNRLTGQQKTDSFGSFSINYVPFGNCKIYATFSEDVGFVQINIDKSKVYDVQITLERKTSESSKFLIVFIVGVFIIVIIIVLFWYYAIQRKKIIKNNIKEEKKQKYSRIEPNKEVYKEKEGIIITDSMKAIIKTLDKNEKEVVEYLLNHNGISTQNKIRYDTLIPKTSLFRCIQRLEQKNIVKTESLGKMKKISLSDFFLTGNENKAK